MRDDNFIHPACGLRIRSRGRLPHWEIDDGTYFITFRLADSLPKAVAMALAGERARSLLRAKTASQKAAVNRAFGRQLDSYLDAGFGSNILAEHGALVANSLKYFDGQRYELHAWCVMPNHVHVLLFVPGRAELNKIVHSWKSFTAHRIGRGVIWAREYYDHVVRSEGELERTAAYIRANPYNAGLQDWPFLG